MKIILLITIFLITILIINITNFKVNNKKLKICDKKVSFNLNNNQVKLISPRKINNNNNILIKKFDVNEIKNNNLIKENNNIYGNKIINNSNFFNSEHKIPNINSQQEFVDKLNKFQENNLNEDWFKNQKPYWKNLNIENFTNREYSNTQVDNFNKFKNTNYIGKNISNIYDKLTDVDKNGTFFNKSNLKHDDKSVANNFDNEIYGKNFECNI